MKKFSCLMAFVFVILLSSTALAANWEVVDKNETNGVTITTSVDKDSIKRGINSKQFKMSRKDGFSALIKIAVTSNNDNHDATIINYVGFVEEKGKRCYYYMDSYDEKGKIVPDETSNPKAEAYDVDKDGEVWPKVWDFITKNLK